MRCRERADIDRVDDRGTQEKLDKKNHLTKRIDPRASVCTRQIQPGQCFSRGIVIEEYFVEIDVASVEREPIVTIGELAAA